MFVEEEGGGGGERLMFFFCECDGMYDRSLPTREGFEFCPRKVKNGYETCTSNKKSIRLECRSIRLHWRQTCRAQLYRLPAALASILLMTSETSLDT